MIFVIVYLTDLTNQNNYYCIYRLEEKMKEKRITREEKEKEVIHYHNYNYNYYTTTMLYVNALYISQIESPTDHVPPGEIRSAI